MDAPPLPREPKTGAAGAGASLGVVADTLGEPETASPAADWICVAAARNILVVDHNDRHLDILSSILASVGHDVETCGSGAEAIRRLDARRFDLVVLDLQGSQAGDLRLPHEMPAGKLNARTPVIVCAADKSMTHRQLNESANICAIIVKPIDAADLILAVARAPAPRPDA